MKHGSLTPLIKVIFVFLAMITISCNVFSQETDQLIVKYKNNTNVSAQSRSVRSQHLAQAANARGVALSSRYVVSNGAQVFKADRMLNKAELDGLISEIKRRDSNIEYVEPDHIMKPTLTPNDPLFSNQWHYYEPTGGVNAPEAWDSVIGLGVKVAVLDTGYRPHIDLAANLIGGYDFISNVGVANDGNGRDSSALDPGDGCGAGPSSWHGTHVAGTIAAVTDNSVGVSGVAFGAQVVPIRVLGCGGGYNSDIADAIVWAAGGNVSGVPSNPHPAKVINMSLGGAGSCSATFQNSINQARSLGAIVVVSAGNNAQDVAGAQPASCNGVIAVAATDRYGNKASYSNYGALIDVSAPGGNASNGVLSTSNTGYSSPGSDSYAYYYGTSMAAPHVAGVVALMLDVNPNLSPDNAEQMLKNTARNFPGACSGCGPGIVNAKSAVIGVQTGVVPMHRYFSPSAHDHFYTTERNDAVMAFFGFTSYDGAEGNIHLNPGPGLVPFHKYYNGFANKHFFRINRDDAGMAGYGFSYQGVIGYVEDNAQSGYVPLHRYYNGFTNDHVLTVIRNDSGMGGYGYGYMGIEAYVKNPQ